VEDGVAAIVHVLGLTHPEKIYCVNDDMPALESDVLAWLQGRETSVASQSDVQASGRRVSNQLLHSTGWQPRYPSYRNGYRQLVNTPGV